MVWLWYSAYTGIPAFATALPIVLAIALNECLFDSRVATFLLCVDHDRAGDVKPFNRRWSEGEGLPLVWVPGAGHNSNVDRPDFVNVQIGRLLGDIRTGGGA